MSGLKGLCLRWAECVCVASLYASWGLDGGKQMRLKWGWGRGGPLSDPAYALSNQDQMTKTIKPED